MVQKKKIGQVEIICGDALQLMPRMEDGAFDIAIIDPPYGASSQGHWNLNADHNMEGFGGKWDITSEEWDDLSSIDSFRFSLFYLKEIKRLVKPSGSIWIHGTYHNIGIVNFVCQLLGLEIINEIIWYKRNAFPNLSCRRLTASHETLLWVHTGGKKRKYGFNYEKVKAANFSEDQLKFPGKQLRTVWDIPNNKDKREIKFGKHPTQKPLRLLSRMLLVSASPGGKLFSPFMGSGSDMIAAMAYGMEGVGIEVNEEYFDIASKRISDTYVSMKQQPELRYDHD